MNQEPPSGRKPHPSRPADLPSIPPGPPLLVILSGPTASGKDAVRELLMQWGLPLHFAVTATSRPKRPNEVDGVDYHFLTDEEFARLIEEGGFIEHALVYGQRKGVPRAEVLAPLSAGQDVVARVDVQGAATLKALVPDALLIFIAAPSSEEERRRLEERDTETDDEQRLRLEAAARENVEAARFDHVLVNETGQLEATARRVVELIAAAKARRSTESRSP